ncbi:MAG: ABC-F family ATP-binding cassette domain-containing protein [Lachnospiraceae bacterium]|nr:ABC-F family ATP-binding cassette domain-containing protein [Lachnospiraceae bacterium]
MLYQITDGTVSAGGAVILSHINFEIKGSEKVAVVGRNGAGKTTLLRLIAGQLELDRDDKRKGLGITASRQLTIGMLAQAAIKPGEEEKQVEELLLEGCPWQDLFSEERFFYETEYDRLFTGFGFKKNDKKRLISSFSGGEQTKIALIRLLLMKPDILLLDEPTNHLDLAAVAWMEQYLRNYEKGAVLISHDRFFLDQVADVVYELSDGKLKRYPGNYTHYRQEKRKELALMNKAYQRQQQEIRRLEGLVERFKQKPRKAAFARSRRKIAQRMVEIEKPPKDDVCLFTGDITPLIPGSKWVIEAKDLKVGYNKALFEFSLRIQKGQKIGIIGENGAGKTALLKTIAGQIKPLGGKCILGNRTVMGYFDQHSAEMMSELSVSEHFHSLFPSMTEKEVRSVLGSYLFGGRAASVKVSSLSGGEKARLALAELLQSRPNLLLLDEPTNHMDIQAKETLESAFQAYQGTIVFISHDRYFIRQVADAILIVEGQQVMYYPFGYEHYLERLNRGGTESLGAKIQAQDQALVAGLRAVPKAERHLLKEMDTEEAYFDWRIRLAWEQLEKAGELAGRLSLEKRRMEERKKQQELLAWFTGQRQEEVEEGEEIRDKLCAAWQDWTLCCLKWYDIWADKGGSQP